jgi:hypothetical protein
MPLILEMEMHKKEITLQEFIQAAERLYHSLSKQKQQQMLQSHTKFNYSSTQMNQRVRFYKSVD